MRILAPVCEIFWNSGFRYGVKSIGFYGDFAFFFFGILDSCCLDAKKIFKTEINVPICAQ